MIRVAQDLEGVRRAAAELLAEPTIEHKNGILRRQAEGSGNADRILAQVKETRTLPDGYYTYAHFLMWLRARVRIQGVQLRLTARDVDGLLAIERALREFEAEHWQCPRCSMWNETDDTICAKCGFDRTRREQ